MSQNAFYLLALPLGGRIHRSYIGSIHGDPVLQIGVDQVPDLNGDGTVAFTGAIGGDEGPGVVVDDAFLGALVAKNYEQLQPLLTPATEVVFKKSESAGLAIVGFKYPAASVPSTIAKGFAVEDKDTKAVFRTVRVAGPEASDTVVVDAAKATSKAAAFVAGALGSAAIMTMLKD